MPRIQGIGSTRSTNRPQGGGNIKQGLPPSVGRPANLMRFTLINAYGGLPAAPAAPAATLCDTVTQDALNTNATARTLSYSAQGTSDILRIRVGWKVTETGGDFLVGTVESIADDGADPVDLTEFTITITSGAIPDGGSGTYTFTNC